MTMSPEVQRAILGGAGETGIPKIGVKPVQVSIDSEQGPMYEFRFGNFHIYDLEFDAGRCASKLLNNGFGPQGLTEMFDEARRQFDALQVAAPDVD